MIQTTDDLIADIKLRGAIPTNQERFTNARFLSVATAELQTTIFPDVLKARQNYYEYDVDTAINDTGLYDIPTRAYLGLVSNLKLVDSSRELDLTWLSGESEIDNDKPRDSEAGVILKRNTIQLKPKDGVGYSTFRMTILLRPGIFVTEDEAAQITGISGSVLSFTSGTIPTSWTTSNLFDLIQGKPQYDHLGIDLSASNITTTSITLSSTPNSRLAVGDWISLAGESPIVQLPEAFSYLLSQRSANTLMRSMGDGNGLKVGEAIADKIEKSLTNAIQPRIQKEAQRIVNRTGILRRNGR